MQDGALPSGEHPFNVALDAIHDDVGEEAPGWRMESPAWAYYSGRNLPGDPARRAEILTSVVRRLNEARRALPNAEYEVTLGDRLFAWDEVQGFQPPPE